MIMLILIFNFSTFSVLNVVLIFELGTFFQFVLADRDVWIWSFCLFHCWNILCKIW